MIKRLWFCSFKTGLEIIRLALMKPHGRPKVIVGDRLRLYGAALKGLGRKDGRETGRWWNKLYRNDSARSGVVGVNFTQGQRRYGTTGELEGHAENR